MKVAYSTELRVTTGARVRRIRSLNCLGSIRRPVAMVGLGFNLACCSASMTTSSQTETPSNGPCGRVPGHPVPGGYACADGRLFGGGYDTGRGISTGPGITAGGYNTGPGISTTPGITAGGYSSRPGTTASGGYGIGPGTSTGPGISVGPGLAVTGYRENQSTSTGPGVTAAGYKTGGPVVTPPSPSASGYNSGSGIPMHSGIPISSQPTELVSPVRPNSATQVKRPDNSKPHNGDEPSVAKSKPGSAHYIKLSDAPQTGLYPGDSDPPSKSSFNVNSNTAFPRANNSGVAGPTTPEKIPPPVTVVPTRSAAPVANGEQPRIVLATVGAKAYLPIRQQDPTQYSVKPSAGIAEGACLATVYTMVERGAGRTGTTIDQMMDRTGNANRPSNITVEGSINPSDAAPASRLLLVHGTINTTSIDPATNKPVREDHFMLGTHIESDSGKNYVVANDPLTGKQIKIDAISGAAVNPPNALASFRADTYESMSVK